MPFDLVLTVADYQDPTRWRWLLSDSNGRYLADHEVNLDPADPVYPGFVNLPAQLRALAGGKTETQVLDDLGRWMAAQVLGPVGQALRQHRKAPACVLQVQVPAAAQRLLFRPLELAHLDGLPLVARGVRPVWTVAGPPSRPPARPPAADSLRILAVYSLPEDERALALRRERFHLEQLTRQYVQTGGLAVDLCILQYGATRASLREALEVAPGWDLVHFSGHGLHGQLVLEKGDGTADPVSALDLADLLRPAAGRLKLATLSACYTAAADAPAPPAPAGPASSPAPAPAHRHMKSSPQHSPPPTEPEGQLPSLGQQLADDLGCAVLAMRYPVPDDFAIDLALALYRTLFEKKQPLAPALQLALARSLPSGLQSPATLPLITPMLFGAAAADLTLQAPPKPPSFALPKTGLFGFPPAPEHFAGCLAPMRRASQAVAPASRQTGVLFHGPDAAVNRDCALELAYRYDSKYHKRFTGFAWWPAPGPQGDVATALTSLGQALERQLPDLSLAGLLDDPQQFHATALPRLKGLLEDHSLLVVLHGLDSLLTSTGQWRDPRWAGVLSALVDHTGLSRVVLTSRHLPATLAGSDRLQREALPG